MLKAEGYAGLTVSKVAGRAGVQGMALERVERGRTADLEQARELFVRSIALTAAQLADTVRG